MGIPEVGGVDERVCLYCCGTCQLTSQPARWGRAKNIVIFMAMFGYLCIILFKNRFNSFIRFSASDWYKQILISFFRHQNFTLSWFLTFWISEPVEPRQWIGRDIQTNNKQIPKLQPDPAQDVKSFRLAILLWCARSQCSATTCLISISPNIRDSCSQSNMPQHPFLS